LKSHEGYQIWRTSVGSAENIRRIEEIVRSQSSDLIVVVSAVGGVTDRLLAAAKAGANGKEVNPFLEEIWSAMLISCRRFLMRERLKR